MGIRSSQIGFLCALTAVVGTSVVLCLPATTQTGGSFVALQNSDPGTAQPGNVNISGALRSTRLNVESSSGLIGYMKATETGFNTLILDNETPNFPSLIGRTSKNSNAGVWGNNMATGAWGLLGYATVGVYGTESGNSNNTAGLFVGNVRAVSNRGNFLADNVFGFLNVMNYLPSGTCIGAPANETMGLFTSSMERMRILSDGRVLINTTTPFARLTVYETGYGFGQVSGSKILSSYIDGANGCFFGTASNDPLHFYTNNSTALMTLTTSGSLGINTATPTAKLEISEPNTSTAVSGAKVYVAGLGSSVLHPGGLYWNGGLEATGLNGIVAGTSFNAGYGILGIASGTSGFALRGSAPSTIGTNYGVYGDLVNSASSWSVYANGRLGASGTKSFRIDHPDDPTGKYLLHYSSEGPEPLNLYSGNVTTDSNGYATVQLPHYFDKINIDPRYQLTVIDESDDFVMAKVAREIENNAFVIRTSAPNTKVSWRVEARRNDRFVQVYGAPVEMEKEGPERGTYQDPKLYGESADKGMGIQRPSKAPVAPEQIRRRPLPAMVEGPKAPTNRTPKASPRQEAVRGPDGISMGLPPLGK